MDYFTKAVLKNIFEFGSFDWRIHSECQELPKAPFKIQLRDSVRGIIGLRDFISDLFVAKILKTFDANNIDVIVDLPLSISPVATIVSQRTKLPLITLDYKGGRILGKVFPGIKALILDDVLSFGHSKEDGFSLAYSAGIEIVGIMVLVDYELGVAQELREKHNVVVHSVFTISELLYEMQDVISEVDIKEIENWLQALKNHHFANTNSTCAP